MDTWSSWKWHTYLGSSLNNGFATGIIGVILCPPKYYQMHISWPFIHQDWIILDCLSTPLSLTLPLYWCFSIVALTDCFRLVTLLSLFLPDPVTKLSVSLFLSQPLIFSSPIIWPLLLFLSSGEYNREGILTPANKAGLQKCNSCHCPWHGYWHYNCGWSPGLIS